MSDTYEKEESAPENFKFLCCISLENGHLAIGVIEVLATIGMIVNMFYAPWFSITILAIFNLPFCFTYFKGLSLARKDDMESIKSRYNWNTATLGVYSLRTIAFTIFGLVWLIYASVNPEVVHEFCDGYTTIKFRLKESLECKDIDCGLTEH